MDDKEIIIKLENVNKVFDGVTIVDNINLEIKKGQFVTFLGPSGCGKTTTLRMISGFEIPTSGKVYLYNKDITNIPPYKRPINTVFQKYALFPHLDVYNNIAFGLKIKKVPVTITKRNGKVVTKLKHLKPDDIAAKVEKALKIVDLEELEDRSIDTLSGGQQQRVAIARAIVNEPEILLLDEPLGALDLKMRKEMQIELKEMHKKLGITFIYVTHDQEEALTMSDVIVVIKDGRIMQIGTPTQIYNEPKNAFVADFIGESNIFNATMVDVKQVRFLGQVFKCVDDFEINENVDVVVRPEDIELTEYRQATKKQFGVIVDKIFKGIHFEYTIKMGNYELLAKSTKDFKVKSNISINIQPNNIQVMKKEINVNTYYNCYLNKWNQVMIGDDAFDCDVTQLLPGSSVDENDYLIFKNHRYDLTNAPINVEIPIKGVEINDDQSLSDVKGVVINSIWKGEHYQVLVRSNSDEDYVLDTEYSYNKNDIVSIIIKKENIKIKLKGDISKYEEEA